MKMFLKFAIRNTADIFAGSISMYIHYYLKGKVLLMSKICKKCNVEINDNEKICSKCGVVQSENKEFIPTIEVLRESSIVGCLLSYSVFVDGVKIGIIKNGEKRRFQIDPGLHEIYIKQNWSWCYSPKISFLLKDFSKFSCKPKVGLLGVIFGRVVLYLIFKRHKFIALQEV